MSLVVLSLLKALEASFVCILRLSRPSTSDDLQSLCCPEYKVRFASLWLIEGLEDNDRFKYDQRADDCSVYQCRLIHTSSVSSHATHRTTQSRVRFRKANRRGGLRESMLTPIFDSSVLIATVHHRQDLSTSSDLRIIELMLASTI